MPTTPTTTGARLARALFAKGDEPGSPCIRIQFMGGSYPNRELGQGGFCETALADWLDLQLAGEEYE